MKVQMILSFERDDQEIVEQEMSLEKVIEFLKDKEGIVLQAFGASDSNDDMTKISICVYGINEEEAQLLPGWYLVANGKLWRDDINEIIEY